MPKYQLTLEIEVTDELPNLDGLGDNIMEALRRQVEEAGLIPDEQPGWVRQIILIGDGLNMAYKFGLEIPARQLAIEHLFKRGRGRHGKPINH